jgi:hypothetical protein
MATACGRNYKRREDIKEKGQTVSNSRKMLLLLGRFIRCFILQPNAGRSSDPFMKTSVLKIEKRSVMDRLFIP